MQHLEEIIASASTAIEAAESLVALDEVRVQYLGKKGELTAQLQSLGKLPPEERREAGQEINKAKGVVQQAIAARKDALQRAELEALPSKLRLPSTLTPNSSNVFVPMVGAAKLTAELLPNLVPAFLLDEVSSDS